MVGPPAGRQGLGVRGEIKKAGQARRVTNTPRSFNWALCGIVDPGGPLGQTVLLKVSEAALKGDGWEDRGQPGDFWE